MTLRFRLISWIVAIVLVTNTVLALATIWRVEGVLLQEVKTRVGLDLNSARTAYNGHIKSIERFLQAVTLNGSLASEWATGAPERIAGDLEGIRRAGGMEMLTLTDASGRVLERAHRPGTRGDALSSNSLVAEAIDRRAPASGTIIVSAADLLREGKTFAERADIAIEATPAMRDSGPAESRDGMVVGSAVPLFAADGSLACILYGADLLNRRFDLVDQIDREVFSGRSSQSRDVGAVTIFQSDVRIATNVLKSDGQRAVGTRMSREVFDSVIVGDKPWNGRAFVVNDWYITAYEPIRDPSGRVIGSLYVGLLEAPFTRPKRAILTVFLLVAVGTTLLSLALLFFTTRHILWPIGWLVTMAHRVIGGDLTARVSIAPPGEMGDLCRSIDAMADAVAEREEKLKMITSRQIAQGEKLAAVGRLAAGVAHEINNPLTSVLTFSHLLRERPNFQPEDREDLDLVIHETERVRDIVQGLLDFSRENPVQRRALDLDDVIRTTMKLVRGHKGFRGIQVVEEHDDHLPPVLGDKNQLQQVLLNLTLNACEAMPEGGTLRIATSAADGQVRMAVTDTGCGIAPEDIEKIFDPFFTTKPVGKGTGLGLSVSYGIVQEHGGRLEVASEPGKGSTFTLILPACDPNAQSPGQEEGQG